MKDDHGSRQSSTGRGEQQSIRAPERRPLHLPAQDLDLMAKHEQFDVAFVLRVLARPDQATQEEVENREQHGSPSQLRGAHANGAGREPNWD